MKSLFVIAILLGSTAFADEAFYTKTSCSENGVADSATKMQLRQVCTLTSSQDHLEYLSFEYSSGFNALYVLTNKSADDEGNVNVTLAYLGVLYGQGLQPNEETENLFEHLYAAYEDCKLVSLMGEISATGRALEAESFIPVN